MTKEYAEGVLAGRDFERERLIKKLSDYFDLTVFSQEVENAPANPEWDKGFNAALALIKAEIK